MNNILLDLGILGAVVAILTGITQLLSYIEPKWKSRRERIQQRKSPEGFLVDQPPKRGHSRLLGIGIGVVIILLLATLGTLLIVSNFHPPHPPQPSGPTSSATGTSLVAILTPTPCAANCPTPTFPPTSTTVPGGSTPTPYPTYTPEPGSPKPTPSPTVVATPTPTLTQQYASALTANDLNGNWSGDSCVFQPDGLHVFDDAPPPSAGCIHYVNTWKDLRLKIEMRFIQGNAQSAARIDLRYQNGINYQVRFEENGHWEVLCCGGYPPSPLTQGTNGFVPGDWNSVEIDLFNSTFHIYMNGRELTPSGGFTDSAQLDPAAGYFSVVSDGYFAKADTTVVYRNVAVYAP